MEHPKQVEIAAILKAISHAANKPGGRHNWWLGCAQ
jgi:hypothetical protein